MKELTVHELEIYTGGDFVDGACAGIGTASAVYAAGALTNWWNPVGWVSGAFIAADLACGAYYLSQ